MGFLKELLVCGGDNISYCCGPGRWGFLGKEPKNSLIIKDMSNLENQLTLSVTLILYKGASVCNWALERGIL